MKKLSLIIVALSIVAAARAEMDSRAALVNELTQLIGIDEMVRDARAARNKQADEVIEKMFAQLNSGMPGLPKETWEAIRAAADKMMQKVQVSWSAEEAIQVWQNSFVADFSDAELHEMVAAAKTPLGRKQTLAGKRANTGLQTFLTERTKTSLETAMKEYVAELQRIVTTAAPNPSPAEVPR